MALIHHVRFPALIVCGAALCLPAQTQAIDWKIVDPLTPVRTTNDITRTPARDTVRLVAPQNGSASAVLVLLRTPEESAEVRVADLAGADPAQRVPVQVRYARRMSASALSFDVFSAESDLNVTVPYYDMLAGTPVAGEPLVPVWLSVKPSGTLPAGTYTGTVQMASQRVPVQLEVAAWRCPPPAQWVTHVGLLLSPETLARQYGVTTWSEQHWSLVEKELDFAAALGNDDLWLSIFSRNHLGHDRAWITFTRRQGDLKPDLSVVTRYLELWNRKLGAPHAVLLEMWNSVRYAETPDGSAPAMQIWVDGKPETVPLPGQPGSEKIWQPVLDGIRAAMRQLGWPDSALMLGCADDIRPGKSTVDFFKKHAAGTRWAVWTHGRGDPAPWKGQLWLESMEVGHYEHMFCPWVGEDRADGITGGWDLSFPEYSAARNFLVKYAPPSQYRNLPDGTVVNIRKASGNMVRNGAGFTRLPLDFWPVADPDLPDAPPRSLLLIYEKSPWSIFYRNNSRTLLEPGPDGPYATVRFEMLREGLQECEARIAIETALVGRRVKGKLESDCREFLRQRILFRENNGEFRGGHPGNSLGAREHLWGVPPDWQSSARRLFELAGRVQQESAARP